MIQLWTMNWGDSSPLKLLPYDYEGTALPAVEVLYNRTGGWASGNLQNVLPNPQTRQSAFAGSFSDELIPRGPTVHQALSRVTLEILSFSPHGVRSPGAPRMTQDDLVGREKRRGGHSRGKNST